MREVEPMQSSHSLDAPTAESRPAADTTSRPAAHSELTPLVTLNIVLRGLMEFGIVLALGIWGYHTGSSVATKLLLAIGAPIVGFGFWGAVDFHQAGRLAEPLRLLQELAISALAGIALFAAGLPKWGLALIALSAIHHVLVYALGQRLIKDRKA